MPRRIQRNSVVPFYDEGSGWQLYELLPTLLEETGPADVFISSFSISEEAIRMFSFETDRGNIIKLHCLFDYTTKKNKIDLMHFAANVSKDIRLSANHAKLLIIKNEEWTVCLVGSANLTPNPRLESGVIFTNEVAGFFLNEFNRHFENAIPYAAE